MGVIIRATFDSPDSADMALMRLREGGIEFRNVSVKPREDRRAENDRAGNFFLPAAGSPGLNGTSVGVFSAGFYPFFGDFSDGGVPSDARSGEARLEFEVEDAAAERARRILISSHGHEIVS